MVDGATMPIWLRRFAQISFIILFSSWLAVIPAVMCIYLLCNPDSLSPEMCPLPYSAAICKLAFGENDPGYIKSLSRVSTFYLSRGEYELAKDTSSELILLIEKGNTQSLPSRQQLSGLNNNALACSALGAIIDINASTWDLNRQGSSESYYNEAKARFQQLLEYQNTTSELTQWEEALVFSNIADLYKHWKKFEEAEKWYTKAVALNESFPDETKTEFGLILYNYGMLCLAQNQPTKAVSLLDQARNVLSTQILEGSFVKAKEEIEYMLTQINQGKDTTQFNQRNQYIFFVGFVQKSV